MAASSSGKFKPKQSTADDKDNKQEETIDLVMRFDLNIHKELDQTVDNVVAMVTNSSGSDALKKTYFEKFQGKIVEVETFLIEKSIHDAMRSNAKPLANNIELIIRIPKKLCQPPKEFPSPGEFRVITPLKLTSKDVVSTTIPLGSLAKISKFIAMNCGEYEVISNPSCRPAVGNQSAAALHVAAAAKK